MENKEQSTQNSPMGMESVTTSMKTIDGNEKQMIEMLNQPTILPDGVSVEVHTKVEPQPTAALDEERIPEEEVLPEIVTDEDREALLHTARRFAEDYLERMAEQNPQEDPRSGGSRPKGGEA